MDIKKFPVESGKIFLADLDPVFRQLEGDVPVDDRVWVVVRQASQADNIKRADMYTRRERKYGADAVGNIDSISTVYHENVLRRQCFECYLTLKDVGNLMDGEKPVFPKMPAKDIPQKEFEDIWGKLHPTIAMALHQAVLQVNPDWLFDRQGE